MQGKAEDAVPPLEKAARASRDPEIETQLAIALRQAGDTDKALLWLKRAIKRSRRSRRRFTNSAMCCTR